MDGRKRKLKLNNDKTEAVHFSCSLVNTNMLESSATSASS